MNAPAVDVATGKAPVPVESEAEKAYLSFMSVYFLGVLATGLLLAGSVGLWDGGGWRDIRLSDGGQVGRGQERGDGSRCR